MRSCLPFMIGFCGKEAGRRGWCKPSTLKPGCWAPLFQKPEDHHLRCRARLWHYYSFPAYVHWVQTPLPCTSLLLCTVNPVSADCDSIPGPETAAEELVCSAWFHYNFQDHSTRNNNRCKWSKRLTFRVPAVVFHRRLPGLCLPDFPVETQQKPEASKMLLFSWFVLSCTSIRLEIHEFPTPTKSSTSQKANRPPLSQIPVCRLRGFSSQPFTGLADDH